MKRREAFSFDNRLKQQSRCANYFLQNSHDSTSASGFTLDNRVCVMCVSRCVFVLHPKPAVSSLCSVCKRSGVCQATYLLRHLHFLQGELCVTERFRGLHQFSWPRRVSRISVVWYPLKINWRISEIWSWLSYLLIRCLSSFTRYESPISNDARVYFNTLRSYMIY